MQLPSNLTFGTVAMPLVAANAQSTAAVIGALGANRRARVWGVVWAYTDTTQAPTKGVWWLQVGATVFWRTSTAGFEAPQWWWPGGFIISTNVATTATCQCDLLNAARFVTAYYTLEATA